MGKLAGLRDISLCHEGLMGRQWEITLCTLKCPPLLVLSAKLIAWETDAGTDARTDSLKAHVDAGTDSLKAPVPPAHLLLPHSRSNTGNLLTYLWDKDQLKAYYSP